MCLGVTNANHPGKSRKEKIEEGLDNIDASNIAGRLRIERINASVTRDPGNSFFEGYNRVVTVLYDFLKDDSSRDKKNIANGLREYLQNP